ncbi:hypothetical protein D1007_13218 [Hordeum vulgare]|nr:hypothetical protein D1007_13218 [Hordeum vulgare]
MVSMAAAKIAVLLAATALFAAAGAADPQPPQPGKETQCWQCYSSCMLKCDNSSCGDVQKYFQCKKSCILDCYKDLPPVCFKMCINETCLTLPAGRGYTDFTRIGASEGTWTPGTFLAGTLTPDLTPMRSTSTSNRSLQNWSAKQGHVSAGTPWEMA